MWFVLFTIEEHNGCVFFVPRMLNFNIHDKRLLEHQKLVLRANNIRNEKNW